MEDQGTSTSKPPGAWRNFLSRAKSELAKHAMGGAIVAVLVGALFLTGGAEEQWHKVKVQWQRRQVSKKPPVVLAVFPDGNVSRKILEGLSLLETQDDRQLTDFCTIRWEREEPTPEGTANKLRKVLMEENVVLLIHGEMSTTVKALNERLFEAQEFIHGDGPIPLILPGVTNPSLNKSPSAGIFHCLRLPANDDLQIRAIRRLLGPGALQSKSAVLVLDKLNPTYAEYIARELLQGGDLVINNSVGVGLSDGGFVPPYLLDDKPDTILFIGMEEQANVFLRRLARGSDMNPSGGQTLNLIFTDGVAGDAFPKVAKSVLGGGLKGKARIFVTGPFPTDVPRGVEIPELPDFRIYGAAARELAKKIVSEVHGRGRVTRRAVLAALQERLDPTKTEKHVGLSFNFDRYGDNRLGEVHVFEQEQFRTLHSSLCPCE